MKKNKFALSLLTIGALPISFLPLTSCNPKETFEIKCNVSECKCKDGKATYTFTLNKEVKKEELNISTNGNKVSISDYSINNKILTVEVSINSNETRVKKIEFELNIKRGENYTRTYYLSITDAPVAQYTIKFESSEHVNFKQGSETEIKVFEGDKISKFPEYTIDENYVFGGWYVNDQEIPTNHIVQSNLTIVAKAAQVTPDSEFEYETDTSDDAHITGYKGNATQIYFPEKINNYPIRYIDDNAFDSKANITKVVFPKQLNEIGENAFNGCTSLKILNINDQLKVINKGAFTSCKNLSSTICEKNKSIWTQHNSAFKIINQIDVFETDLTEFLKSAASGDTFRFNEFTNDSWQNVTAEANKGLDALHTKYKIENLVGQERLIKLNNINHRVRVIGEGHDKLVSNADKKAALTFELVDLYTETKSTKFTMNLSNNQDDVIKNGYTGSDLHNSLNHDDGKINKAFKDGNPELKDSIKEVTKDTCKFVEREFELQDVFKPGFPQFTENNATRVKIDMLPDLESVKTELDKNIFVTIGSNDLVKDTDFKIEPNTPKWEKDTKYFLYIYNSALETYKEGKITVTTNINPKSQTPKSTKLLVPSKDSYNTKLFPLTQTEMVGTKGVDSGKEGELYAYWADKTSYEKQKCPVGSNEPVAYWLTSSWRYFTKKEAGELGEWSPGATGISINGRIEQSDIKITHDKSNGGVSFAFCIGQTN